MNDPTRLSIYQLRAVVDVILVTELTPMAPRVLECTQERSVVGPDCCHRWIAPMPPQLTALAFSAIS